MVLRLLSSSPDVVLQVHSQICSQLMMSLLWFHFVCVCAALPHCTETICGDGGTCRETDGGFTCVCPPLKTGRHCEIGMYDYYVLRDRFESWIYGQRENGLPQCM